MTPLFVPDASVILKWALRSLDEEHADRALAIRSAWLEGMCELEVPTLWTFEVANVLGRREPTHAGPLMEAIRALRLPEAPPEGYVDEMLRLMRAHGVTAYDAAYHALARVRRGVMVTADRRYVQRAASAGHVMALAEWRS